MREREHQANHPAPSSSSGNDDQLAEYRNEADRISNAADDIVARLLTSNSQSFVSDSRQSGGQ